MTMLTLTAGTTFIMWLGEQITERGIGNGISLIIFSGIVARMPVCYRSYVDPITLGRNEPISVLRSTRAHGGCCGGYCIYGGRAP